jgi:hypothetical protein
MFTHICTILHRLWTVSPGKLTVIQTTIYGHLESYTLPVTSVGCNTCVANKVVISLQFYVTSDLYLLSFIK